MTTYTLTARNGESPSITFEVSATFHWIMAMVEVAEKAFRDITVICDETGEVIVSRYQSSEVFGNRPILGTLMRLKQMCAEMNERTY